MRKFFLFLFILHTSYFILPTKVLALAPVIINKSEKAYPPSFGTDQDYVPSNPDEVSTTTYVRDISISQSFDPECSALDQSTGQCTAYTHQTINKIEQQTDLSNFTNHGFRNIYNHLTNFLKNPLASPEERMTAYKNYNLNSSQGSGNFTNRGMSYRDWLCAFSRKIDAVADFIDDKNSTCADEEVSPNVRFGKSVLALSRLPSAIRKKSFLDSVQGNFYYPNCEAATIPTALPDSVISAFERSAGDTPSNPLLLFQNNALNPMCSSSLASKVVQCDLDDKGNEKCKPSKNISIPLGGGAPAASNVMAMAIPASHKTVERDFGATTNESPIQDRPNKVWWQAIFTKAFWDDVLSSSQQFSGPTRIKYSLDNRAKKGLEIDQDANTFLIPNEIVRRSGLNTAQASSTDSKTTDPGYSDNMSRQLLHMNLTPCSWQPGCQM